MTRFPWPSFFMMLGSVSAGHLDCLGFWCTHSSWNWMLAGPSTCQGKGVGLPAGAWDVGSMLHCAISGYAPSNSSCNCFVTAASCSATAATNLAIPCSKQYTSHSVQGTAGRWLPAQGPISGPVRAGLCVPARRQTKVHGLSPPHLGPIRYSTTPYSTPPLHYTTPHSIGMLAAFACTTAGFCRVFSGNDALMYHTLLHMPHCTALSCNVEWSAVVWCSAV